MKISQNISVRVSPGETGHTQPVYTNYVEIFFFIMVKLFKAIALQIMIHLPDWLASLHHSMFKKHTALNGHFIANKYHKRISGKHYFKHSQGKLKFLIDILFSHEHISA